MGDVTVPLSRTYEAHGRTFSEVILRAPLGKDHDAIGDITEVQFHDGRPLIIYHDDRLLDYRRRLLKVGDGLPTDADLAELSLADAMAVKEAVRGFFSDARATLSERRRTDSSSATDGASTP